RSRCIQLLLQSPCSGQATSLDIWQCSRQQHSSPARSLLTAEHLFEEAVRVTVVRMHFVHDEHAATDAECADEGMPDRQDAEQHLVDRADADLTEESTLSTLSQPLSTLHKRVSVTLHCGRSCRCS